MAMAAWVQRLRIDASRAKTGSQLRRDSSLRLPCDRLRTVTTCSTVYSLSADKVLRLQRSQRVWTQLEVQR